jgi:hypothetical protein
MAVPLDTPREAARRRRANLRLGLVLAAIAATFFAGVIVTRYVGGFEAGMSFIGLCALALFVFAIVRNLRDR